MYLSKIIKNIFDELYAAIRILFLSLYGTNLKHIHLTTYKISRILGGMKDFTDLSTKILMNEKPFSRILIIC